MLMLCYVTHRKTYKKTHSDTHTHTHTYRQTDTDAQTDGQTHTWNQSMVQQLMSDGNMRSLLRNASPMGLIANTM